jgi:myo-inositol 2-dehydrogenase/D-chiro-inositol 1-dehydrogenase
MTIRVGAIGAGNMGASHIRDLSFAVSGSEVSVVYDFDQARAAAIAVQVGARSVGSVEELMAADDVDAILIASPDDLHAEHATLALATGKPILCEKPLAVVESEAKALVETEAESGSRRILMGFMRRFDPGYTALKAELTPEGIGSPLMIHNVHTNTAAPYGLATERTLTNMVVHEFDIARWLLNEEIASVMVLAGKAGPLTTEGERDPILVILESASGVIVEVQAFVNSQAGYEVACRVTGEQGQAQMGDGSFITRTKSFSRGTEVPEQWLGRFADAYRLQLQGWIDALLAGGTPPGASAWDGYVATIISNRAIESYRTGQRVAIDLPPKPAIYA